MYSYQQTYQKPVSYTNSSPTKPAIEESDISEDDDEEESDDDTTEDDEVEETDDDSNEEEDESLLVLESEDKKEVTINSFKEMHIIQASNPPVEFLIHVRHLL
ncbi:hypothetical protein G6F70_009466 [Rhizopus microsporus]|nr:hypothetical protein G6F71_009482 [Rhizopus microsporus]KAG1189240.1 hypothetical protein G6F70_009466 [Rhizopus microsporus]